jgi:hypothetical protein
MLAISLPRAEGDAALLKALLATVILILGMGLAGDTAAQTAEALHAAAKAGDTLSDLGPLGAVFILVVLGMAFVIFVLWRTVGERDVAIAGRDKRIDELQDSRAKDGKEYAKMLAEQSANGANAIAGNTAALTQNAERLLSLRDTTAPIAADLERILASVEKNGDILGRLAGGRG